MTQSREGTVGRSPYSLTPEEPITRGSRSLVDRLFARLRPFSPTTEYRGFEPALMRMARKRGRMEDGQAHKEELDAGGHRGRADEGEGNASGADRDRLAHAKVELDRYWDLLRRRRAAAAAGVDEGSVGLRSETTVESYLQ